MALVNQHAKQALCLCGHGGRQLQIGRQFLHHVEVFQQLSGVASRREISLSHAWIQQLKQDAIGVAACQSLRNAIGLNAGLLGHGDVAGFALICLASGLALGADLALPAAIAADLGERQGQSGTCFGVWNFVAKLNLALAAGLALPLLDLLGYRPGGAGGLGALTFAYALLPLGFKLLAALLLWRWRDSLEIRS